VNTLNDAPYSAARLKRGLAYFAIGKAAAALLGVINFALIVQVLAVSEYAAYVSIIAAMELAIAFSTFGVDWAGLRYLPEVREHGNGRALCLLIFRLCSIRLASLAITALLGAAVLSWLVGRAQLQAFLPIAQIYLLVLLIDGMLRFILSVVFDSLLLQGQSQASLLVRNAVFASGLAIAVPGAGISHVAHSELVAACGALVVALALLLFHLHATRTAGDTEADAQAPDFARMRRMALHNYLSLILNQPYSPQALILLAGLFLPAGTTAMLGFARNFTDLIRRYQPVELLLGLLRPLLISSYAKGRNFSALARMAQLIYKVSLLTLCPVLVACIAYGDELIAVISGHKYPDAYWLIVGLAWTLVLRSHRLLVGTMANILDRPDLLTRTAAATLVVLPVCVTGFACGYGPLTLFIAALVEEAIGTWVILRGIGALGYAYAPPWPAMVRVAVITFTLSGLLVVFRLPAQSMLWLILQSAFAAGAAVALALASGYFDAPERSTLRGIAGLRTS